MSDPEAVRLHALLVGPLGEEATNALMAHLPSVPASDLATRSDLALLRAEVHELRAEMHGLRAELKGEIADLRTEVSYRISEATRLHVMWSCTALIAGLGASAAITAAIVG